jgi:hypothetical protein
MTIVPTNNALNAGRVSVNKNFFAAECAAAAAKPPIHQIVATQISTPSAPRQRRPHLTRMDRLPVRAFILIVCGPCQFMHR